MKTIIFDTYSIYGTASGFGVDLFHRGVRLNYFIGERVNQQALIDKAHAWAKAQGFTHARTVGQPGRVTL
jgi:hypothetical protein